MVSRTETRIPGPFYWALNVVADSWKEFRYPARNGEARRLGGMEFAIYHQLCRWADNDTRECRRYQCDIGEQFNISPNPLRAYLRNLEGAKLISMERGRIIGHSLTCAPTTFKLLDIEEALRLGRSLIGDNPETSEQPSDPCADSDGAPADSDDACANSDGAPADSDDACANSDGAPADSNDACANYDSACADSDGAYAESATNKRLNKDSAKTQEKTCCARDDTDLSSSSMDLPDALRGEQGRERFPRLGELAAWCGEHFGRAAFPAEMTAPELEPFEEELAKLDGLLRQSGRTAVEAITTRFSLRPEVRGQYLVAKNPESVLGRQINFAVEDFSARRGDTTTLRPPEPVARLPASTSPFMITNVKPEWMTDNQWEFYKSERLLEEQSTARDSPGGY